MPFPGIEEGFGGASPHRPEPERRGEKLIQRGALVAAGGGEADRREISRGLDAHPGVRLGDRALGGGDVGPALQELRGEAQRDVGGGEVKGGLWRQGELLGAATQEDRKGMLDLRPEDADVDRLRPGRVQLGLRGEDIASCGHPHSVLVLGNGQGPPVVLHGLFDEALLLVEDPDLDVILGKGGLEREACGGQVGGDDLCRGGIGLAKTADLAPEVRFPRGLQRGGVGSGEGGGAGLASGALCAASRPVRREARQVGGAVGAGQLARLLVGGSQGGEGLVGGGDLAFEAVENGVVEGLPPGAAGLLVRGRCLFPAGGLLEGGGCLEGGSLVVGSDGTAGKEHQGEGGRQAQGRAARKKGGHRGGHHAERVRR